MFCTIPDHCFTTSARAHSLPLGHTQAVGPTTKTAPPRLFPFAHLFYQESLSWFITKLPFLRCESIEPAVQSSRTCPRPCNKTMNKLLFFTVVLGLAYLGLVAAQSSDTSPDIPMEDFGGIDRGNFSQRAVLRFLKIKTGGFLCSLSRVIK